MTSLLIKNASVLVAMDGPRREIPQGAMLVEDGVITAVGSTDELSVPADDVIDLTDHVVLPGLINTHHHFYQTLTRAVPGAQDAGLFDWLTTLYPIWARVGSDHLRVSTQVALAELALSGCTTAFDHTYLFPNGSSLDDQIAAASAVGLRFHASRGSMSLGESDGGLPPDSVVEDEDVIISDTMRVIDAFHDGSVGSMVQVVVAPCSPFSVTPDLMRESAALARDRGVRLHTHLAETVDEESFCLDRFGHRPVGLARELGWLADDAWFAHGVFIGESESAAMAAAGTGVAHCATSNMRLASGIAPVRRMLAQGVPVGLGVDGSASNDGSNMLAEVRQAMLLARLDAAPDQRGGQVMGARAALEMATIGGARVLGRSDIGSLEVGKQADFVAVNLNRLEFAGAHHDPVAAMALVGVSSVDHSWVGGERVVESRQLATLEIEPVVEEHNRLARTLVE